MQACADAAAALARAQLPTGAQCQLALDAVPLLEGDADQLFQVQAGAG